MNQAHKPIRGSGTPASEWLASSRLAAVPAIAFQTLLPAGAQLAVVAPHPDDEVLGCGGLLAALAPLGVRVSLLAVTDGEASHPGSSLWPSGRLRQARLLESARALHRLGLPPDSLRWVRLGFADSQVARREAQLVARLEQALAGHSHVITTWREDGHCDHEAVGRATALAADRLGIRLYEVPIWAWHWAAPEDPRIPWQRAHKLLLTPAWLARKQAAIGAHRSQLQADPSTGAPAVLSGQTLARFAHPFEVYFL